VATIDARRDPAPRHPPAQLDELDRRIVAVLQANTRATWRQIATAVDTSEATVKRRVERLRQSGAIRITVYSDTITPGTRVLFQFRCEVGAAQRVALTLAQRDDVRFVALITGPWDIVAEMIVPSKARLAQIVVNEFPRIGGIVHTTTETVVRNFKTAHDWSQDLLGDRAVPVESTLTLEDARKTQNPSLDHISQNLLHALRADGRASYTDLAQRCGIAESVARYRVDNLFSRFGVRAITLVDPALLGYEAEMFLWLRVHLAQLETTAAALAARREVRYLSATLGYSDLVCEVILRSGDAVFEFFTRFLGELAGIQQMDSASELVTIKRGFVVWSPSSKDGAPHDQEPITGGGVTRQR
jgi:DNA-binding Lrp family transcriptional regulator